MDGAVFSILTLHFSKSLLYIFYATQVLYFCAIFPLKMSWLSFCKLILRFHSLLGLLGRFRQSFLCLILCFLCNIFSLLIWNCTNFTHPLNFNPFFFFFIYLVFIILYIYIFFFFLFFFIYFFFVCLFFFYFILFSFFLIILF